MSNSVSDVPNNHPPKHFILDTNVLLHNPNALFSFGDNCVVIPFTVIEELDTFKKNNDDVGRHARQVIRHLDELRVKGKLSQGVKWNGYGGTIMVDMTEPELPNALNDFSPDNRIISCALQHQSDGHKTIFISKDINARIKSDTLGLITQDYEAQKVDAERLYLGYLELDVTKEIIDQLYQQKQIPIESLRPFIQTDEPVPDNVPSIETEQPPLIYPNQFAILHDATDPSHTGLCRRYNDNEIIEPVKNKKMTFGIIARNVQQTMALDLLMDESIKLVTLLGTAGSGKTLMALAAALQQVFNDDRYERVLVARPIMPMGRDLGYLPGDVEDKLAVWMQPIFDNINYLLSVRGGQNVGPDSKTVEQRFNAMRESGKLVLEPLTYIRGRSIPNQFIIVDEAQNLTPHEVKTIASRVGNNTKLVMTGDIAQIDNPYLDSSSNGLSYMVEQLKGQSIVAHTMLAKSERSELASIIVNNL